MGFGGARKAQNQQLQQLQMQLMQQNLLRSQMEASQASNANAAADADAKRAAQANLQEEQAKADLQKRSKLSIFDAITTNPGGLLNSPKTGKLTLLGN